VVQLATACRTPDTRLGRGARRRVPPRQGDRFREGADGDVPFGRLITDFGELVLQSFVAASVTLLAFGVIDLSDSLSTVVHLVLHELEFRGHSDRVEERRHLLRLGNAVVAYAVGAVVGAVLLFGVGQFEGRNLPELVQMVIVVSFPGATGASAGEVVL
jgi:integral membrane sensor domain MASE1